MALKPLGRASLDNEYVSRLHQDVSSAAEITSNISSSYAVHTCFVFIDLICWHGCLFIVYVDNSVIHYSIINAEVKMPPAHWLITKPSPGKKVRFDLVSV